MKATRREFLGGLTALGGWLLLACEGDAGKGSRGNPNGTGGNESDPGTFVLGETKPSAENTGLAVLGLIPSDLTTVPGNVTHEANDLVFEKQRFAGKVNISGKRITYRNCWFNGPHTETQALAQCSHVNCEQIVFENCLFLPSSFGSSATEALANCVFGHDFELRRCDLSGAVDCVGLYSGVATEPARNVSILGSFLHDMTYYSPDPGQSDNQTHNDGIQIHRGAQHLRVFGTTILATLDPLVGQASDPPKTGTGGEHLSGNEHYPNLHSMSGFMFSPVDLTAGIQDIEIDKNWLSFGMVHINWPRDDGSNVRITNNRWGGATFLTTGAGDPIYILMLAGQSATISGNAFEATGVAYDRRSNG
jgi:hypothetical protein